MTAVEKAQRTLAARMGTVYMLYARDHGVVKVGYSSSTCNTRIASLLTSNAAPLEVIGKWHVPSPSRLENELHQLLAQRRRHGEWFATTDPDNDPQFREARGRVWRWMEELDSTLRDAIQVLENANGPEVGLIPGERCGWHVVYFDKLNGRYRTACRAYTHIDLNEVETDITVADRADVCGICFLQHRVARLFATADEARGWTVPLGGRYGNNGAGAA